MCMKSSSTLLSVIQQLNFTDLGILPYVLKNLLVIFAKYLNTLLWQSSFLKSRITTVIALLLFHIQFNIYLLQKYKNHF